MDQICYNFSAEANLLITLKATEYLATNGDIRFGYQAANARYQPVVLIEKNKASADRYIVIPLNC